MLDPSNLDFDALWNYADPAQTEATFRQLLAEREQSGDIAYRLQLLTQIARAQGLQAHFDEAQATLDRVEEQLTPEMPQTRIRYLLEQGRVLNSSGHADEARSWFQQAWDLAQAEHEAGYAIDAAHMVAIVASGEEQLAWNLKALQLAESMTDERSRRWCASLYNNIGWSYHDTGRYNEALDAFQKALDVRQTTGPDREIRIARWCVGRALRSLQRYDEALALQQGLLAEWERSGEQQDGYVDEEIAECLLALGQQAESRPYFAQAYAALSNDLWLARNEPERLQRLNDLGQEKGHKRTSSACR
jgi:tetratricopeptide (TPR) repeat protein